MTQVYVLDHVMMVYRSAEKLFKENCAPLYTWEELVPDELWRGVYHGEHGDKDVVVRRRTVR
jgi:hypothetical protein